MIEFNPNESNSIKSITNKKNMGVDVTTRFIKGKMLMFWKLSLKSIAYDFIDKFRFQTEKIQEIYNQYSIIKCRLYLNLIDTDSCLFFCLSVKLIILLKNQITSYFNNFVKIKN